jgi:hypothetical protein
VRDVAADNNCGCERHRPIVAFQPAGIPERRDRLKRGDVAGWGCFALDGLAVDDRATP